MLRMYCFSMLLPCLSVLKLWAVSSRRLLNATRPSRRKANKSSRQLWITNRPLMFMSCRANVKWPQTTKRWAVSNCPVFLRLPVEYLASKLPSISMPTALSMYRQRTSAQVRNRKLPLRLRPVSTRVKSTAW